MPRTLSAVAACAATLLVTSALAARDAHAGKETYIFLVSKVDLSKGVPKEIDGQVTTRLTAAIDAHPDLEAKVPAGAPDPGASPDKFKSYLARKKQRAFKMNVLISQYSKTVEPAPDKTNSQYLTVRVSLRLFAETFPGRGFALTGDGSATVKLETAKGAVRPVDAKEANSAALEQAVNGAIGELLIKLRQPPPKQQKPAKKKKK